MSHSTHNDQSYLDRYFINSLREVIGLYPLYDNDGLRVSKIKVHNGIAISNSRKKVKK